jgi:hypothetical protein
MSRTMWFALFCLIGLGAAIAIKAATPPAEHAQHQGKMEPAFALNESAKSDRLELADTPGETGIIVPATGTRPVETPSVVPETGSVETPSVVPETGPVETPSASPETRPAETPSASSETTRKIASKHWRDANARITPVAPPRRHTKSKESKKTVGEYPVSAKAGVWHCRQDAMGSLLRSLDLSPRCNL